MYPSIRHLVMILALLLASSAQADDLATAADANDFNTPAENLVTGGQPSQEALAELKAAGVTKIINLRGPDESVSFDPKAVSEALGMEYISLPVAGADDVTSENAQALHQILQDENDTVFLHCASGNRVGALLAIAAHQIDGESVDDSLKIGRAAGLGSLEGRVRSVLDDESLDR